MERRWRTLARFAKPACFMLVIALLLLGSRITVPYTVTAGGATGMSESQRSKVIITSFDGQSQTTPQDISTEDPAPPVNFNTWNETTDQMIIQPDASTSSGCSTEYNTVITVDIGTANELSQPLTAVMNVSVTERDTGEILSSHLVTVDFKPGETNTVETTFSLETSEANPVLVVAATFPSKADLQSAPATVLHVPLFEYILMKAGVMPSTYFD